ncbi:MAG TPA: cytochrome c oxidase subunit II [Minicystis sp.]|nr:cytochrome c oxidase subunit II [Minicystis sp.]
MNDFLRRILFLPPQASTVARTIDTLHYFVILTTMAGAALVTLVGGYFLIRYRRRDHDEPQPHVRAKEAKKVTLVLEWATIVGLTALFFVWWVIGMRDYVELRVAPAGSMQVYVTAKQWMWKFAYPEGAHSIADLVVPAGRPVKLVMTSRDVIHSFYVPDFRIKEDVLPGRYTTAWFEAIEPGTYQIFCAEFCGTSHSTMLGQVVVLAPADFQRWLAGEERERDVAGQRYTPPAHPYEEEPGKPVDLAREGEKAAADEGCLRCHSVDGTPHIGPTWAGLWGATVPLEHGADVVADEAYLTESMMDPAAKVHRGFSPVMPSFQGRLRPAETAAILEYIKSLRDVAPLPGGRERQAGKVETTDGGVAPLAPVTPEEDGR